MENRSVLITGGAGFVGFHLGKRLLKQGFHVVALDDLSTGSIENIRELEKYEKFSFVRGSIATKATMKPLIDDCEIVFHLAATVGVKNVIEDPVQTIENNIEGTSLLLNLVNNTQKRVFIFSTSEVYGKSKDIPFSEDGDIVMGSPRIKRWSYAISKLLDESLALSFFEKSGLNVSVVRLFNTVGVRQKANYGMVVPNFVDQALAGDNITIFGDGEQTRSFTDVRDTACFLESLIDCKESIGEIINIGGGIEISINQLAKRVLGLTEAKSGIITMSYFDAYGAGYEEMPRRVPNFTKLYSLSPYRFRYSLNETLAWIIDWKKSLKKTTAELEEKPLDPI